MKNFLKRYKKKILISVTSISLCVCILFSSVVFVSAADSTDETKSIDYNSYGDAFFPIGIYNSYDKVYTTLGFWNILNYSSTLFSYPTSNLDGLSWAMSTMPEYKEGSSYTRSPYMPYFILPNVRDVNGNKYSNNFGDTRLILGKSSKYWSTNQPSSFNNINCFKVPANYSVRYRINMYLPQITSLTNIWNVYCGLRFYLDDGTYISAFPAVDYAQLLRYTPGPYAQVNNFPYTTSAGSGVEFPDQYCVFISFVGTVLFEDRVSVKSINFQLRDIQGAQNLNGLKVDRFVYFHEFRAESTLAFFQNFFDSVGDWFSELLNPIASWLGSVFDVITDGFNFIIQLFSFLSSSHSSVNMEAAIL